MQDFALLDRLIPEAAIKAAADGRAAYIAGGTDAVQLWQNGVEAPARVVDIAHMKLRGIIADADGLNLGALASMSAVAAHPDVVRDYPVISQALLSAASPQIRNMGTMGGNLLQRTRCLYFRNTAFACNKRAPGSGCPAIAGHNRDLAVLGGSLHCIATHPSDMPVALLALDAAVKLRGAGGDERQLKLAEFYRLPGDTPDVETNLSPGELIVGIAVPASDFAKRSVYLKVRDRTSFQFALVSVAVALHVQDGRVMDARVAMGGVAPMPWRLQPVEAALIGKTIGADMLAQAASLAAADARPASQNGFKPELMRRTVLRALQRCAA